MLGNGVCALCPQDIKNAKDGQDHVYHSVHMPLLSVTTQYCMSLRCCLSVLCGFAPQMSEHCSLPMLRANLSFSFRITFLFIYIYCSNFATSTQHCLAAVATSISPLSDLRNNQFTRIHLRVFTAFVLGLARLFELRTKTVSEMLQNSYIILCAILSNKFQIVNFHN